MEESRWSFRHSDRLDYRRRSNSMYGSSSERGYDEATFVESFVILNAVGGECLEDFDQLRADAGLAELVAFC